MASDWVRTASPSTSAGTRAFGLSAQYCGANCWPPSLSKCTAR
ncbi:Uncharacterised protein [Bordetella pertussis]|nr:Uncharacterised protein [Bordetella pertussis]